MNLTNFGEQFASKVLKKTYSNAVFESIVNKEYEGEIKKAGDRVNILSFLNSGELSDYVVGTNMVVGQLIDAEDQLVVEKRKYYSLSLDRLEDLFAYADDIPESMILEYSKVLDKTIDTYVLDKFGSEAKAGNWIGIDLRVIGDSTGTMASIVTSATGGTVTLQVYDGTYETSNVGTVEV